jgi:hypothetical protein
MFVLNFSLKSKIVYKKNLLLFVYSVTIVYSLLNILIHYANMPEINNFNALYRKNIFIPYIFSINLIILFYILYVSTLTKRKIVEFINIIFEVFNLHNIVVITLFLLYLFGLNKLSIGVDNGYNIPRGFGLTTEPSYSSLLSLMSIIYFYHKKNIKFYTSLTAFFLAQSGTGLVMIFIISIIILIKNRKNKKTIFTLILLFPMFYYLFIKTYFIKQFNIILASFNVLLGTLDLSAIHNPRIENIFYGLNVFSKMKFQEILFGRGIGSTIYYMNSITGTFNFYLFQIFFEGGIILLILHLIFIVLIYNKIRTNLICFLIVLSINIYWLINGGVLFYMFYIFATLFYFYVSKDNYVYESW